MAGIFNTTRPVFQWLCKDTFVCCQALRFQSQHGDLVEAPILHRHDSSGFLHRMGFVTDFASKPWLSQILVDGPADEGLPAYVLHDALYCLRYCVVNGKVEGIGRDFADALLVEMLHATGMDKAKADLIYAGVRIGGGMVWGSHGATKLADVTVEKPGDDFAVITVRVQPDFDVQKQTTEARRS